MRVIPGLIFRSGLFAFAAFALIVGVMSLPGGSSSGPGTVHATGSDCGSLDVAFIIDTTGSMVGAIANVQAALPNIVDQLEKSSGGDLRLGVLSADTVVAVGDGVYVNSPLSADIAAVEAILATPNLGNLGAGGGTPEATDEAINTAVNNLIAADRPGGEQVGDFNVPWRFGAKKIIILITDEPPGGFDDTHDATDKTNAHDRAVEAAAAGINISAVYVPTGGKDAQTLAVMNDYADTTLGLFIQTAGDGTGTDAAISEIIAECGGGNPNITKAPRLANLWLCNEGVCDNKESGVEGVNLDVNLNSDIISLDPKCVGFPNFSDPATCETQKIGSFEFEVRFDAKYVTVDVEPGSIFTLGTCGVLATAGAAGCAPPQADCITATGEGFIQFACVTKGKPIDASSGPGTLAVVRVRPTADVYKLLIPNQENGIVTQLINQGCQLSDLQGHPIKTDVCGNAAITIRYLEGDVHADCVIDVMDQQQVAFRWGAQLGNLLYDARYDLEPSFPQADGDIDAKDLQFVYGRRLTDTSTCKNPHPAQPPMDPQVKVGPPATNG